MGKAVAPAAASSVTAGRGLNLILATALFVIALIRLWPGIEDTPFHRDEARWISNASLLKEWRHPLSNRWQDEGYKNRYGSLDEQNRRRAQPPLAMYVLGLGLLIQGQPLPATGYWIMSHDNQWNIDHGNKPSASLLHAARRIDVVVAALTVVALFAIGTLASNRIGGVLSGLVYGLHPVVLDVSTHAWADPLFVLLVAWTALAGYWLFRKPGWGQTALFGILLGLGGATKLSPLIVAAAIGVFGIPVFIWTIISSRLERDSKDMIGADQPVVARHPRVPLVSTGTLAGLLVTDLNTALVREHWRKLRWQLIATPAIAFAAFVAVYPYLWTNPITHTWRLFDFRAESFKLQGDAFPPADVPNRIDALRRARDTIGGRNGVGALTANWLHDHLDLPNWTVLHHADVGLAVIGLALAVTLLLRKGPLAPPVFMLGIVIAQAALVLLTMGVAYPRYFLPIELTAAALSGLAFGSLANYLARFFRSRSEPVSPDT